MHEVRVGLGKLRCTRGNFMQEIVHRAGSLAITVAMIATDQLEVYVWAISLRLWLFFIVRFSYNAFLKSFGVLG